MAVRIESKDVEIVPDEYGDASWLDQEGWEDRRAQYMRGDFGLIGVRAVCQCWVRTGSVEILQEIRSGGLWGIESDSGDDYIAEIGGEQLAELDEILSSMFGATVQA